MKKVLTTQRGRKLFRFLMLLITISACYLNSNAQTVKKYSNEDVKALNGITEKWERYWNFHNMDSMGTLLRDDVDFTNVGGRWMKGKIQVVQDHKAKHENVKFKTSLWQTDSTAIVFVKPDVAIIHVGAGISGDFENDGTPRTPRHIIGTWVAVKENNKWLLHTVQNGNITVVGPAK